MRIVLVLAAAVTSLPALAEEVPGPEESYVRTAHAARRTGPIRLDGKLDEPAWQAAPENGGFTQASPDEGKPASVRTVFRFLWDDDALYFGAICDDPEEPTATLSRRDRQTEGDSVQFDLDTTLDQRTAYHFQVFAAGQQLDALHYNDTSYTGDWDAAWESAVARTPTGWSVEMRIPLRVMRIPENARLMGLNVYRILSRRHEEDQWRYRPRGRPGDISRFGLLDGIEGIHPVRSLELRPYVGASLIRAAPALPAVPKPEFDTCAFTGIDQVHQVSACAGLDLRYNLASDLALVATINPDFGQVEADQRVLNLSTFETFFPEKRPFFLEGLDLFKSPLRADVGGPYGGDAYQIFYSRRIGRAPDKPDLNDDQTLVHQRPFVPVLGAAKVTGTVGKTSVGMLSALEPRVFAEIDTAGSVSRRRTIEARNTAVLRLRRPMGDVGLLGFTGTASDPFSTDAELGLTRHHAHVGAADLTLYNHDRSLNFVGQAVGSLLTGHEWQTLRDGTTLGPTASGAAYSARVSRESEYTFFSANSDLLTPQFTVNDLGFMPRANLFRTVGLAMLRNPHQTDLYQSANVLTAAREVRTSNFDFLLERDALLELNLTSTNFWYWNAGVLYQAPYVDDRELEDGTPIERQKAINLYGFMNTDSRSRLQLQFYFTWARAFGLFERQNQLGTTLVFRPLPQLDGTFDLSYNETAGTIRQIRPATALPGQGDPTVTFPRAEAPSRPREYLLAEQQARSISATLRATYAFTPYLTLQAYAQLFTLGIAYGKPLKAMADPGKPLVTLGSLVPATDADRPPNADERQASLNVNLILRWEWRTGSTFYLVYAHESTNDATKLPYRHLDLAREFGVLGDPGVTHGDTILVKVDLLTAL